MNSLTQPTECNKKKTSLQFPSALTAPPRVGSAKSRLFCTRDHSVTSTTTKQPKHFADVSVQKFLSVYQKERKCFLIFYSGSSRIFLNYTWPPLICPPSLPIQLSRLTAQSRESFPGRLSNPIRPLHFPSSDAQLLSGFFILHLHMAFTKLT